MTTAKLSGDKLKIAGLQSLFASMIQYGSTMQQLLNVYSPDEDFKNKVMRQIKSAEAIVRKELYKSIER